MENEIRSVRFPHKMQRKFVTEVKFTVLVNLALYTNRRSV